MSRVHASETSAPPSFKDDVNEEQRPVIPYAFIIISFLCASLSFGCSLLISITSTQLHNYGNGSSDDFYYEWDFRYEDLNGAFVNFTIQKRSYLSNPQKEMLKAIDSIGFLIALFPVICIYNKYGFCRSFLLTSIICAITSFIIPGFVNVQTYVIALMLRVIQGMGWTCVVPLLGKLANYISMQENKFAAWLIFSYMPASAVLCFPLAGILSSTLLGWHTAHHFFGALVLILLVLFILCHYSEDVRWDIKERRWKEILRGHSLTAHQFTLNLPYLSIYQDFPLWSCFFAATAHFSVTAFALELSPMIYVKVLDIPVAASGFLLILGPLGSMLVGIAAIKIFDRIETIQETGRLRIFQAISGFLPAIIFLLVAFIDPTQKAAAVAGLVTVAEAVSGFAYGGVFKMTVRRSRQFTAFILLHLLVAQVLALFLTSLITALITQDNEYNAWSRLFIGEAGVLAATTLLFYICASPSAAPWTNEGFEDTSMQIKRDDPLPQFPL